MYNKTTIVGHLGKDPETRYTPSGVPVTTFSVATSRRWTNANGEAQEKTTWFRVTCWRKLAEITGQYLLKGRLVLVEGDIDASAWKDKQGEARASLELTATTVKFLGGKEGQGEQPVAQTHRDEGGGAADEDLPF